MKSFGNGTNLSDIRPKNILLYTFRDHYKWNQTTIHLFLIKGITPKRNPSKLKDLSPGKYIEVRKWDRFEPFPFSVTFTRTFLSEFPVPIDSSHTGLQNSQLPSHFRFLIALAENLERRPAERIQLQCDDHLHKTNSNFSHMCGLPSAIFPRLFRVFVFLCLPIAFVARS